MAIVKPVVIPGSPLDKMLRDFEEKKGSFPSLEDEANMSQFFVFSPFLAPVDSGIEQLFLILGVVKLAKTKEGLKVLRDVAVQYLKTVGQIVSELQSAASSNWLTAMINQRLSLRICRRMGLISASEAASLNSTYAWMFSTVIAKEGIVDTITALGSMAKGVGSIITGLPKGE